MLALLLVMPVAATSVAALMVAACSTAAPPPPMPVPASLEKGRRGRPDIKGLPSGTGLSSSISGALPPSLRRASFGADPEATSVAEGLSFVASGSLPARSSASLPAAASVPSGSPWLAPPPLPPMPTRLEKGRRARLEPAMPSNSSVKPATWDFSGMPRQEQPSTNTPPAIPEGASSMPRSAPLALTSMTAASVAACLSLGPVPTSFEKGRPRAASRTEVLSACTAATSSTTHAPEVTFTTVAPSAAALVATSVEVGIETAMPFRSLPTRSNPARALPSGADGNTSRTADRTATSEVLFASAAPLGPTSLENGRRGALDPAEGELQS
mmetsp:Transcript_138121/g.441310  ORF Transcript_138121/g.441310 Transcript_138121/m.441310 type:complete len:327 (-) Transcript_138121:85-1065(-)